MPIRIPFEENAYYHVYNRGLNHNTLFFTDRDFQQFLWYIEQDLEKFKEEIWLLAYCLLPNHFHLVVHNKKEGSVISKFVGAISVNYIRRYKAKYHLESKGKTFFEWRFKAKKLDSEEYLQTCIKYVELNALKHELVDDIKQRAFTSWSGDESWKNEIVSLDWEF